MVNDEGYPKDKKKEEEDEVEEKKCKPKYKGMPLDLIK